MPDYSARIFAAARMATPFHPGLPPPLAALVAAQAAHESGNFTSPIFTGQNNAFGYSYYSGSPYQSGAGVIADNGLKTARYASIEDSTREIVDWIGRRVNEGKFPRDLSLIQTPADYAYLLKQSGYYSDSVENYTMGLQRFWDPATIAAGGAVVLISLGLLLWLFLRKK